MTAIVLMALSNIMVCVRRAMDVHEALGYDLTDLAQQKWPLDYAAI